MSEDVRLVIGFVVVWVGVAANLMLLLWYNSGRARNRVIVWRRFGVVLTWPLWAVPVLLYLFLMKIENSLNRRSGVRST